MLSAYFHVHLVFTLRKMQKQELLERSSLDFKNFLACKFQETQQCENFVPAAIRFMQWEKFSVSRFRINFLQTSMVMQRKLRRMENCTRTIFPPSDRSFHCFRLIDNPSVNETVLKRHNMNANMTSIKLDILRVIDPIKLVLYFQ